MERWEAEGGWGACSGILSEASLGWAARGPQLATPGPSGDFSGVRAKGPAGKRKQEVGGREGQGLAVPLP